MPAFASHRHRGRVTLIALVLALAGAACGSDGSTEEITITAGETKADPFGEFGFALDGEDVTNTGPTITVSAGEPVTLTLVNRHGQYERVSGRHDWAVVPERDDLIEVIASGEILDDVLWGAVTPQIHSGETAEIEFVPETPGTYVYICTIPGHARIGMMGTFVVEEA